MNTERSLTKKILKKHKTEITKLKTIIIELKKNIVEGFNYRLVK